MNKRLCTVTSHEDIDKAKEEILKDFNIHPNPTRFKLKAKNAKKLYDKGEYDTSVLKIADCIEEYLVLHIIDTIPLKYCNQYYPGLPLGTKSYERLLKIDIDSLCEALELLVYSYSYSQKEFDIIQFLDKIKSIIESATWDEKIRLHKVIVKYIIHEDVISAKKEIGNKNDIIKINDVELLTVCLDVFTAELSYSEDISIIEKIIKNTESPTVKLQYQTLLGIQYMLMGVEEKAIDEIKKAIEDFYINETEKNNIYTYFVWGNAYYMLGTLTNNEFLVDCSINKFTKTLSFNELNNEGKAELLNSLGFCYKFKSNYNEAKTCYIDSIELFSSNTTIIYLVDCLADMEEDNKAEISEWDKKIEKDSLNKNEEYDYLIFRAKLALKYDDYNLAEEVLKYLKELNYGVIYFDNYVKEVTKRLEDYCVNKNVESKSRLLIFLAELKSRIMLEPNFYGIGFRLKKD
jgi:tetratricopeptide (TPR) repeat protein